MKIVRYKRRRKGKTDYRARFKLLVSGLPRVIIRKTNRYIIIQIVKSQEAQDFVVSNSSSKELLEYGWPSALHGSLKSVPAAYLTGFLFGKKSHVNGKVILDIGLQRSTVGNRIYAALKGIKDAGIEIPCNEKMFPKPERIEAKHMKKELSIETIKKKMEEKWKKK